MIESMMAAAAFATAVEDEPAPLFPEIICGELRTGRILTTIDCATATWSVLHNDAGRVECEIPLRAMTLGDATELVGYLDPARCYLAVRVGDNILEAGPIWQHKYNDDTGTLTVTAAGLWSLFDHRKVVKVLGAGENPATTSLAWNALSLGTIAKRLVETAQAHVGGSLPLVLPTDETAADDADHARTYNGYNLASMGESLRQLTGVINGPDIAFSPRLTADRRYIEWELRTGTEADPLLHQLGGDWAWDLSVPRSGLSGLSVDRDATGLGYRAWVPGSGTEQDMPIAMREDLAAVDAGFPLLEVTEPHSSTTTQTTLDAHADALLGRSLRPWSTWSWQVRLGGAPLLGEVRPGDWGRINVPADHPYLAALSVSGHYRTRIVGVSGDLGSVVTVTALPMMEAR